MVDTGLKLTTMTRQKVLTVTIKDCDVEHFRSGGKGGQNQNKRDTGTRVIHRPSGAVGESREERSQLQNKRKAFRKMAESDKFQRWVKLQHSGILVEVEKQMHPRNLIIETYDPNAKN